MVSHSLEEAPNECCGILAGKDGVVSKIYRITNTTRSPYRYLMDPQEMLRAMLESERNGREILAFYHSHTHSAAYPSPTDVRMAQQSGWLGDDVYYILVSLEDTASPQIRAFHIRESGEITEERFEVD
jgi:proteasome lid subunit RPN8/RPN11